MYERSMAVVGPIFVFSLYSHFVIFVGDYWSTRQGIIELDLTGRMTDNWSSNLINYVVIFAKRVCEWHEGKNPWRRSWASFCRWASHGNVPFPPSKVGDNTIEAWYAKGIGFYNTIEVWYAKRIDFWLRRASDMFAEPLGRFSNFFQKGFQNPIGLEPSSLII